MLLYHWSRLQGPLVGFVLGRFGVEVLQCQGIAALGVQVAERMIYLSPNVLSLRKEVVRIYLGRGDEKHALKHLQYCFKVNPQDVDTLELLGSTFHRLGANDKAVLVYCELAEISNWLAGFFDELPFGGSCRELLVLDRARYELMPRRRMLDEEHPPAGCVERNNQRFLGDHKIKYMALNEVNEVQKYLNKEQQQR